MSEPSREEKIRTIKIARKVFENMMSEYFPADEVKRYCDDVERLAGRSAVESEPPETDADRARLEAVLAAARSQRASR